MHMNWLGYRASIRARPFFDFSFSTVPYSIAPEKNMKRKITTLRPCYVFICK